MIFRQFVQVNIRMDVHFHCAASIAFPSDRASYNLRFPLPDARWKQTASPCDRSSDTMAAMDRDDQACRKS